MCHATWGRLVDTHKRYGKKIYRIPNSTHFSTSVTTKTWSRGYSGHSSSFQWLSESEIWRLLSFSSGSFSSGEFFPRFPFWTKISTLRKDTVWIFHKRTSCWISINQQKNCNLPHWYQAQINQQQKLFQKQLLLLNPRLQTSAMRRYLRFPAGEIPINLSYTPFNPTQPGQLPDGWPMKENGSV